MKPVIFEPREVRSMGIHISTIAELQISGLPISVIQSRRIRWQCAWHWSKSHGWQKRQVIEVETVTSIYAHMPVFQLSSQPPIQPSSMPIRANHDRKIWCDICKTRYGKVGEKWHDLAMTPARWLVISETMERAGMTKAYCQPCANFSQTRHDGSTWTFREQLDYAVSKETLDGMES